MLTTLPLLLRKEDGDVTLKGGYRMTMDQLAHQTWQGGKIVQERFVYDTAA